MGRWGRAITGVSTTDESSPLESTLM